MNALKYALILFLFLISSNLKAKEYIVSILIYDEVYLMDFAGPLEIFNDAMIDDSSSGFKVFLVSPNGKPIKAHTGTIINADYSIQNAPKSDIMVIPGGNLKLAKENKDVADWIIKFSKTDGILMSVCTGAFILADLGLLDNQKATTWYGAKTNLKKKYPLINVVEGQRYTDNGNIITTSGVSAGIDGALYLVERLFGKEESVKTAKYIEWER